MAIAARRKRRVNPQQIPTVCAWCGAHMHGPEPVEGKPVSHGICAPCLDAQLAELEEMNRLPSQEPHRSNPHCWWLRELHPPARNNPVEVEVGVTTTKPPRPGGKAYREVVKSIDNAFQKASIDSSINYLKTRAWHLFVRFVLPERTKARKMLGRKLKFTRKASTPSQLRQEFEFGRDWDLFAAWRLEPAPEIEHPVDHLVELVTALEMALAGTGPVPRPWSEKICFEAIQYTHTVHLRYKTATGARNGALRKAKSLRAGTKTKRPNAPAAEYLESWLRKTDLGTMTFDKKKLPKDLRMPGFRKAHQGEFAAAAGDERRIMIALYAMLEDPRVAKMVKFWQSGIPAAYGGTRNWSAGKYDSYAGKGYTFVDLRAHQKDFLRAGSQLGEVGGVLRKKISFALVMSLNGGTYGWWFLGDGLEILLRAQSNSPQMPFTRRKRFTRAEEKKAWNIIVKPQLLPVVVGIRNFEEAVRRYLEQQNAGIGRDKWNVYPFDPVDDVRVIWSGNSSKRPKPTKSETYTSVVKVMPALIEPFFVVVHTNPKALGPVADKPSGGTMWISFPQPQPAAIWKKAFQQVVQAHELAGIVPSTVRVSKKPLMTQKRFDQIRKSCDRAPAKRQEEGVEKGMCAKWPDSWDEAQSMFGKEFESWEAAPPAKWHPETAWSTSSSGWAEPVEGGPHAQLDDAWSGRGQPPEVEQDPRTNPVPIPHQAISIADQGLLLRPTHDRDFQIALREMPTDNMILALERIQQRYAQGMQLPPWWRDNLQEIRLEITRRTGDFTPSQARQFKNLIARPFAYQLNPRRDFHELLRVHGNAIDAGIRSSGLPASMADDVRQDVLMKLWQSEWPVRNTGAQWQFVKRVARNSAIDAMRLRTTERKRMDRVRESAAQGSFGVAAEPAMSDEDRLKAIQLLKRLPNVQGGENYGWLLERHYLDRVPIAQIAAEKKTTPSAIKSMLYRARQLAREVLKDPRENPMDLLVLTNPGPKGGVTKVASVLFEKAKWTQARARKWLKDHGYKTRIEKGKKAAKYFRAPQMSLKPKVRTITFSGKEGIKALVVVDPAAPKRNPAGESALATAIESGDWKRFANLLGTTGWNEQLVALKTLIPKRAAGELTPDALRLLTQLTESLFYYAAMPCAAGTRDDVPHIWRQRARQGRSEAEGLVLFAQSLYEAFGRPRANPSPSHEALEQYAAFHATDPARIVEVPDDQVPVPPQELVALGELEHVQYKAPNHSGKKGAPWRHRFGDTVNGMKKNPKLPILATDPEGKGLYIVGGEYSVKPEGIVG